MDVVDAKVVVVVRRVVVGAAVVTRAVVRVDEELVVTVVVVVAIVVGTVVVGRGATAKTAVAIAVGTNAHVTAKRKTPSRVAFKAELGANGHAQSLSLVDSDVRKQQRRTPVVDEAAGSTNSTDEAGKSLTKAVLEDTVGAYWYCRAMSDSLANECVALTSCVKGIERAES